MSLKQNRLARETQETYMKMIRMCAIVWVSLLAVPLGYAGQKRPGLQQGGPSLQDKRARIDCNDEQAKLNERILKAACQGDLRELNECLAGGADKDLSLNSSNNWNGALCCAAYHGHKSLVCRLLSSGVNVDAAPKNDGVTALITAASRGHLTIVRQLLHAGANIEARVKSFTALGRAVLGGHTDVVKQLLSAGAIVRDRKLFDYALQHASPEMMRILIQAGAELMPVGGDSTPLEDTSKQIGSSEGKLSSQEATMSQQDKLALQVHIEKLKKCQDLLIKAHASVLADNGDTILHVLFRRKSIDLNLVLKCITALDEKFINHKNMHGYTPLHSAAPHAHPIFMRLLQAKGADSTLTTPYGDTYDSLLVTKEPHITDPSQWTELMRLAHEAQGNATESLVMLQCYLQAERHTYLHAKESVACWKKITGSIDDYGFCQGILCDLERRAMHITRTFESALSIAGCAKAKQLIREHVRGIRRELVLRNLQNDWQLMPELIYEILAFMGTY